MYGIKQLANKTSHLKVNCNVFHRVIYRSIKFRCDNDKYNAAFKVDIKHNTVNLD